MTGLGRLTSLYGIFPRPSSFTYVRGSSSVFSDGAKSRNASGVNSLLLPPLVILFNKACKAHASTTHSYISGCFPRRTHLKPKRKWLPPARLCCRALPKSQIDIGTCGSHKSRCPFKSGTYNNHSFSKYMGWTFLSHSLWFLTHYGVLQSNPIGWDKSDGQDVTFKIRSNSACWPGTEKISSMKREALPVSGTNFGWHTW